MKKRHTEKACDLMAGVLDCNPTEPGVVDNLSTRDIARALADEHAVTQREYARTHRRWYAARRVQDILGASSTAGRIAYAVACGDVDVAAQMAELVLAKHKRAVCECAGGPADHEHEEMCPIAIERRRERLVDG